MPSLPIIGKEKSSNYNYQLNAKRNKNLPLKRYGFLSVCQPLILVLSSPEFIIPLSIHGRYYLFYLLISGNDFTHFIIWTQFEFSDQDFAWLKFVLFLWFVQCYLLITGKSKIVKLCTKLMFAFRFYKWKGLNFKLMEIEKSIMPQ